MTEPIDDELDAVIAEYRTRIYPQDMQPRFERAIMRAAIAKFGNPAPAGVEPIGYLYCGGSYGDELEDWEIVADQHQCDKLNEHHGALGKEAKLPIYTTPQPTQPQAGAVPLTLEAINAMAREYPAEDLCGWSYRMGVADTERHHGIKGGQHG